MERTDKIAEEIKKELSGLLRNNIKDPRLPEFVSVTAVKVTRDLRYAKVYISVLGDEEKKKSALAVLKSASGFIRREIGQKLNIRYTPEFTFKLDDSIEYGIYLSKLIDKTVGKNQDTDTKKETE
jgi:ribosome-binding factor A